ncbi:hypothetical protein TELCIR_04016 [Teladorsagia circumcincta]|uniref:Uncharacterized protein n=1 Tax=Teladorsagia circumcincta TaxID=45464 RepID=A0A2G9UWV9_TELCI|nr:hypothetical protein TELCIR_04016 [Teladorsagia circumcincta]
MNHNHVNYNHTTSVPLYDDSGVIHPSEQIRLADDNPFSHNIDYNRDGSHMTQDTGDSAKGKLNEAGRAIKNTAEKVADKAVELKDKAKEKIQDGVDKIKGH